ncbi:hypothetical protein V3C99_005396 [Haemonchus contortus]
MTTSLHEIKQHLKMARTLDSQLTHHLLSTTEKQLSGGELMLYASRLLRTAVYAKEKILWYTQRYMLVNSIFRMATETDRVSEKRKEEWYEDKEHDINQLSSKVAYELKILDRHIADIEEEINIAEKKVLAEKTENTPNFISTFNTAMEKVEKTIVDAIAKMKENQPRNSHEKRRRSSENDPRDPTPRKVQLLSDDDYMEKLIEENHDDLDEYDERRQKEEESRRRERQEYIEDLENELDQLYQGRTLLPHRKIGDGPETVPEHMKCAFCGIYGRHYSDSCSLITDGDERYRFIQKERRCRLCLGKNHGPDDCRTEEKSCWYCDVIMDTALDFLISKQKHHRALCRVPNSKDRITKKIRAIKVEINRAKYEQDAPAGV